MDKAVQNEFNKLSRLQQYKNKPVDCIEKKAIVNVKMQDFVRQDVFQDLAEKELAEDLFTKYLSEYNFEKYLLIRLKSNLPALMLFVICI